MKRRISFALIAILIATSCISSSAEKPINNKATTTIEDSMESVQTDDYVLDEEYIQAKAEEALKFVTSKNMNTDFCILIDMNIHSGRNRFFVWDFKEAKITHQFLVGHGCCDSQWSADYTKDNPKFSNVDNSHCSSLGKYKIGQRGYSNWGVKTKYLLHGLEESNSNALKRIIVFHSWETVSDEEIYPRGTPEGWGCPTLSNNNFKVIDAKLKIATKPVLMWIFRG